MTASAQREPLTSRPASTSLVKPLFRVLTFLFLCPCPCVLLALGPRARLTTRCREALWDVLLSLCSCPSILLWALDPVSDDRSERLLGDGLAVCPPRRVETC